MLVLEELDGEVKQNFIDSKFIEENLEKAIKLDEDENKNKNK